jgi:TetR/AcrR family transcriptional regulator
METTKERIMSASLKIFSAKGKYGATMDEIASIAGVNKAMVYYHFSSKDNLYREVLKKIFQNSHENATCGLIDDFKMDKADDFIKFLTSYIEMEFDAIMKNADAAKIVLEAIVSDVTDVHDAINSVINDFDDFSVNRFIAIIKEGISKKIIRNIDPRQFVISMRGMIMMYFIGAPMAKTFLNLSARDEQKFLRERAKSIIDLVFYGILEKRPD